MWMLSSDSIFSVSHVMQARLLSTALLLWFSVGHSHPPNNGNNRLIIGTLVRLRRAASADVTALTTEQPKTTAAITADCGNGKNTTKDTDNSLSNLDNKILLLMIVPPDKVKTTLKGKPSCKKRSRESSVHSRPRASKAQCAAELTKKLEIAENLAKQLLTNSSMALLASQAETKNATLLVNKISDAIDGKIKYISDVRPVINCEETSDSTAPDTRTTQCPVTTASPPTTAREEMSTTAAPTTSTCSATTVTAKCPAEASRKPSKARRPSKIHVMSS